MHIKTLLYGSFVDIFFVAEQWFSLEVVTSKYILLERPYHWMIYVHLLYEVKIVLPNHIIFLWLYL
jgi:hypothetical protein